MRALGARVVKILKHDWGGVHGQSRLRRHPCHHAPRRGRPSRESDRGRPRWVARLRPSAPRPALGGPTSRAVRAGLDHPRLPPEAGPGLRAPDRSQAGHDLRRESKERFRGGRPRRVVNPLGLLPSAAIVIDSRTRRIKNVSPPAGFYASTGLPPEEVTALLVRNEQLHRGSNLSLRSTNLLWGDGEGWCLYLQRLNRSSHGGGQLQRLNRSSHGGGQLQLNLNRRWGQLHCLSLRLRRGKLGE